jgi:hypothetical protein
VGWAEAIRRGIWDLREWDPDEQRSGEDAHDEPDGDEDDEG